MSYKITSVDVWVGDILNRPGQLARVLEALANAGAQLEFMVARRVTETTTRLFIAPLSSERHRRAAYDEGLVQARGMFCLRIDGIDRAGLAAELARSIADKGVNIRGASAAALGRASVLYFAFATPGELLEAKNAVSRVLKKPAKSSAPRKSAKKPKRVAKPKKKTAKRRK